jgi:dynein heavy chain 1
MEVLAPSQVPSPGPNGVANTPFAAIDPGLIYDYLQLQLKVTLGANSTELEAPGSLFDPSSYDEFIQRIARFAADSQTALYIQKELVTTDELGNGPVDSGKQTTTTPC